MRYELNNPLLGTKPCLIEEFRNVERVRDTYSFSKNLMCKGIDPAFLDLSVILREV